MVFLICEVNAIYIFLASIVKCGAGSGIDISLQDWILAQALLDWLCKITTCPVYGFVSNPVLSVDIGIDVGEDGLLMFNVGLFDRMFEERLDLLVVMIGLNGNLDDIVLLPDT